MFLALLINPIRFTHTHTNWNSMQMYKEHPVPSTSIPGVRQRSKTHLQYQLDSPVLEYTIYIFCCFLMGYPYSCIIFRLCHTRQSDRFAWDFHKNSVTFRTLPVGFSNSGLFGLQSAVLQRGSAWDQRVWGEWIGSKKGTPIKWILLKLWSFCCATDYNSTANLVLTSNCRIIINCSDDWWGCHLTTIFWLN